MKQISTVRPIYKIGKVDDEIIQDSKINGLSEVGIKAMIEGDVKTFKHELDSLGKTCPGNIWACWCGYALWFNSANERERRADYNLLNTQLRAYQNVR
jgi:hypothetical protein